MKHLSVTVFGAGGFVGRHLVRRLAAQGARITAAVRDPEAALFLKTMGNVGQIAIRPASVTRPDTVAAVTAGADVVVNLAGILTPGGKQDFQAVHVDGAANVAAGARDAGVRHLVHLSAIGAAVDAPSKYLQSKAAGEEAVRAAFPDATILRPSLIFGPEDRFFNLFATMARYFPVLPMPNNGTTRFQPVYVGDVAAAAACAVQGIGARQTLELGGPEIRSFRELMEIMLEVIERRRLLLPLPLGLSRLLGNAMQILPAPLLTRDQVESLTVDNIVTGENGLDLYGIEPASLAVILPTYLARFRRGGHSHRPHAGMRMPG